MGKFMAGATEPKYGKPVGAFVAPVVMSINDAAFPAPTRGTSLGSDEGASEDGPGHGLLGLSLRRPVVPNTGCGTGPSPGTSHHGGLAGKAIAVTTILPSLGNPKRRPREILPAPIADRHAPNIYQGANVRNDCK